MNNNEGFENASDAKDSCCSDTSCCPPKQPMRRELPKIGRNDPCFCGSEKKFKKCCGKNN